MRLLIFIIICTAGCISQGTSQPISVYTTNPHYLEYKGKPVLLITSAEHYGAVLNLDLDYITYLNALQQDGMNYTRIFTGVYIENSESFGIEKNTLAPLKNRVITPWARSNETGYYHGGNKFDLSKWDSAYFTRLKDFLAKAYEKDIIVEITLFSSIYRDDHWQFSPLHPDNNINGTDNIDRKYANTLQNENHIRFQEAMVRKIVKEVNAFDNVFFEIQNEPWSDQPGIDDPVHTTNEKPVDHWSGNATPASQASLDWQKTIAAFVVDEEKNLTKKHLIAQNYTNFRYPVLDVDPNISIMNFHYAWPEAVYLNYAHNKVINFDESGFSGDLDETYRIQAWNFMLAGGGVFNNLDYSFVPGQENGDFMANSPGRGSKALRKQLKFLREFLEGFNFSEMWPDPSFSTYVTGAHSRALINSGKEYSIYFYNGGKCQINYDVPQGTYHIKWIKPASGKVIDEKTESHSGGPFKLSSPEFESDICLSIKLK
ncbi:hypothetical protein ACFLU5_16660 [Bacteroidota bacterium]